MSADYFELLKHPKWQQKRLRILERDNWACVECGDGDGTLHVHHNYYEKGVKPWEYPDDSLRTLCETCHERNDELRRQVIRAIGLLGESQLQQMIGVATGFRVAYLYDCGICELVDCENPQQLWGLVLSYAHCGSDGRRLVEKEGELFSHWVRGSGLDAQILQEVMARSGREEPAA